MCRVKLGRRGEESSRLRFTPSHIHLQAVDFSALRCLAGWLASGVDKGG